MIFSTIFLIFLFLFILNEKNRKQRPLIPALEYYNDPFNLINGTMNSLIKMYDESYIFNYKSISIHNKFTKYHNDILKEFETNFSSYSLTNPGVFSDEFYQSNNKYGYFFVNYYGKVNTQKFPILSKLIEDEDIYTCFFSVIEEKKKIKTHRGPYAGILRYHYTLFSNNDKNDYLKVKNKKLYWMEKKGFLFDDTHYHKVSKKSNGTRVAIIIDIKRKLPYLLDKLNTYILNLIYKKKYVNETREKLFLK